ncbi:MAG: MotA/TolQ/ExbB proton channel family protein [Oligoflexia bacterium]|nr:MotA/TolQ/ExbB proton channel family protein [Oligoflexia bacterium]MBF0365373.1 MotA/TolQ/ExbB proton channel family protein [Oligoflexia bacterium]
MEGKINILQIIVSSGIVVKIVLLTLISASIYSWALIFKKRKELNQLHARDLEFLVFYRSSVNLNDIYLKCKELPYSPSMSVFQKGHEEFLKIRDGLGKNVGKEVLQEHFTNYGLTSIERAIKRALSETSDKIDASLSTLASIGSIAPFIGLFGTVWGIIDAFVGLSSGITSLDAVAPGIAEALVATAIGLAAAIPAVFFYNHFNNQSDKLISQTESYAHDFLNMLERLIAKPSQHH